ncbi:MAG: hypothetical protein SH848_20475 [Saprospiraceae bacterium]|nr:hypothetical protein [Saprospiraceae bacterium]MDZ4706317.1 hypothetical protein [Saprospiraceae bacterium]
MASNLAYPLRPLREILAVPPTSKGALIGLYLDIKLLELSADKYDLQRLMRDLSKFYGTEKPFRDDELFPKIAKLTYRKSALF